MIPCQHISQSLQIKDQGGDAELQQYTVPSNQWSIPTVFLTVCPTLQHLPRWKSVVPKTKQAKSFLLITKITYLQTVANHDQSERFVHPFHTNSTNLQMNEQKPWRNHIWKRHRHSLLRSDFVLLVSTEHRDGTIWLFIASWTRFDHCNWSAGNKLFPTIQVYYFYFRKKFTVSRILSGYLFATIFIFESRDTHP